MKNFSLYRKYFRNYLKRNKAVKALFPPKVRRLPRWKFGLLIGLYVLVIIVFMTAIAFAWFAKDLPTPSRIANRRPTESTKIYDKTGKTLLYETGEQKRTIIQSDQISPFIKDATIATEDANFYKNHGFETRSIVRALFNRVTHRTSNVQGTSTITQQYVKNALLTSNRSLARKFKELILAVELEMMFKKDDILTMYLNEIPYGNSTAGCEAASKMYYGKTCKELDLAQAATLVAIPQAPTYYSPYGTHTDALVGRKNYVLDRMVSTGKISKEDADKAKLEDTTTVNVAIKPRHDAMLAPHFAMYVLEDVANQYGEEKINKEGLKILSTLDYDKQVIAEQAITDGAKKLKANNASNGALVSIDPKTGQILAMVGSIDYFDTTIDGNVNVTDSLRQPGSSFKIFEYSTLLKQKEYSPSKILFDLQTDFGGGYVPKNYNGRFSGPVTVRSALQNSLNIPAVKTMALAGLDNTIKTAEDLGITSLTDRSRYGLSLALGAGEVRPTEMASAYGTLANNGNHQNLTPILKITDSKGKTLYDFDKDHKGKQAIDSQIAYQMSNILSDNAARTPIFGARSALFFSGRTVAAKTGTTQESRDGWACGYTPSIATVVWVGNNMPSPMKKDAVDLAGPIFHSYMEKALANTPDEPFKQPEGIQAVTVDKFSNKLPTDLSPADQRTTDIFASWQVPTDKDDVHIKLRVCKSNGKLAPSSLPDSLTEERIFTNLHSEKPDNSNWENPVRGWASGNGMANLPPTDYCSASDAGPTISIATPINNATLSGSYEITVSTGTSNPPIKSVEYYIDDVSIGSSTSASTFPLNYSFNTLSVGGHKLTAIGTDQNGDTANASITINVENSSSEISISSLGTANLTTTGATIGWATSIPTTGKALYSTATGGPYITTLDSSLKIVHSVTLTGLSPNTKYYYKVISDDDSGGSASSEEKSFTTPAI